MTPSRSAGVVSRGLAAVIDLAVVLAFVGIVYCGIVLATLALTPRGFRFPALSLIFSSLGFFAVAVLYLAACWAVSGCTAGAVVMGLRVVGRNGELLGWSTGLLRALACVAFPVGLAWVAVDRGRRSLQDIAFGSYVVYNRPP